MPLILKSQKAHSSNKPPSPDEKLFTHFIDLQNQPRIWRSHPQPDHITIVGWLRAEHFKGQADSFQKHQNSVFKFATGISGVQAQHASGTGFLANKGTNGKLIVQSHMDLGVRHSTVFFRIERFKTEDVKATSYKLRLEFNPRKLGAPGAKKLYEILSSTVDTPFDFAWFLADAWITRLDVAIDFTNFFPSDVIVTAKSQGTTIRYNGADGALETIQVHSKKKPVQTPKKTIRNPAGPLIVKLYDRNRERQAHGKIPPYHGYQVTRLERISKKNAGKLMFVDLLNAPNPFTGIRLSLAACICPVATSLSSWLSYCAARQSTGPKYAGKLAAGDEQAEIMRLAYNAHSSNLLQDDPWTGWTKGVEHTGLPHLLGPALVAQQCHA